MNIKLTQFAFALTLCFHLTTTHAYSDEEYLNADLPCLTIKQRNDPAFECVWESDRLAIDYKTIRMPKKWYYLQLEAALAKLKLYSLPFEGKPNKALTEAVKKFQQQIKTEPTGQLLICEWLELAKQTKTPSQRFIKPGHINFEAFDIDSSPHDLWAINGSWSLINSKDLVPHSKHAYFVSRLSSTHEDAMPHLKSSIIECNKKTNICTEDWVAFFYDTELEDSAVHTYLKRDILKWNIKKWDGDEIIADAPDSECLTVSIKYNIKSNKLYKILNYKTFNDTLYNNQCTNFKNVKNQTYEFISSREYAKEFYDTNPDI